VLFAAALLTATVAMRPPALTHAEDPDDPPAVEGSCVFPFTPTTYEDLKDRHLFLDTIELAAFNMLFPGDQYFGLPDMEIGPRDNRTTVPGQVPPVLLKAIAYIESGITQGASSTPYGSIGPALIAFDCGHGVAQVTTDMTVPSGEIGRGSPQQALVASNFAYNIARGANILVSKWNEAPEEKPIAGTDTNSHPALLENWYFAVWAYNGFTGPGSNKSNHPMDPIYGSWPRTQYSCGPEEDGLGHNRANYPYQELVLGCAANPPVVEGEPLWSAQPIGLPDLSNKAWAGPLDLKNFVFPYSKMDIPSPQPFHLDLTPPPDPALRDTILGSPEMAVSTYDAYVAYAPGIGSTVSFVDVFNTGTGVLTWYAMSTAPWLTVSPYTGVAVGTDLPCAEDVPCDRAGHMELSVDTTQVPEGEVDVQVLVQALGTPQQAVINVHVSPVVQTGLTH
jgi:hypothetical protein